MTANATMTKEEELFIEILTKYVVPIIFSIILFTGSIGNILVIYVVRPASEHHYSYPFIIDIKKHLFFKEGDKESQIRKKQSLSF